MAKDVIIALDFPTREDTLAFLRDNVTERRSGLSVIAAPEGE